MPIYDYECNKCGKDLEVYHGTNEKYYAICECGGKMIKQVSKGVGISFKGTGFYTTDYKK